MPYAIWSDMFSIKMPFIDNQHRKLLEIVNDFYAAIIYNMDKKDLFKILNSLIQYAETHFRDEEKIMEIAGYPPENTEEHKKIHEQMVNDIFNLHQELIQSEEKTIYELEIFLNNWLVQHILNEDKKLQPYCEKLQDFQGL